MIARVGEEEDGDGISIRYPNERNKMIYDSVRVRIRIRSGASKLLSLTLLVNLFLAILPIDKLYGILANKCAFISYTQHQVRQLSAQKLLQEYRVQLITAEQKAQEDYDKTVVALSGGALGISFAFIKDIVGTGPLYQTNCLFWAWISWGVSVACVLASFYFSQQALRRAIIQIDNDSIHSQHPGGMFSRITSCLNALGGLFFLAGLVLIIIFVSYNMR